MKKEPRVNRVVFQPETFNGMQSGINQVADAIRPTLGPFARNVAITKVKPHNQLPEMLDSGGIIARRIIQLPDRDVDTGAMFIRQLLWSQHEQMGDGTATTAVIFQSIYNQSLKFIAAGGNAMVMRRHLENGIRLVLDGLIAQTISVEDEETIAQVAQSVCLDAELSNVLGGIFNIIGVYGQIDIRSGRTRDIEREYVGGTIYDGGYHTQMMINVHENVRAQTENPSIFLSDLEIEEPSEIITVLRVAAEAGLPGVVVVCRSISDEAVGVLMKASQNPTVFRALAVKTPGNTVSDQSAFLEDLGVLTGGKPTLQIASGSTENLCVEDLGQARRVWADNTFLGVIGGKGDPRTIRQHVSQLKGRYEKVDDQDIRNLTLTRLGKFMGGSATLFVGALSEIDIEARKEIAKRAIAAVRGALLKGVIPGGGAALLACKHALDEKANQAESLEERVSFQILSRALEEPTRAILDNAGYEPGIYISRIIDKGDGYGVDVRSGKVADMALEGIFDSTGVLLEAVRGAISSAALAITVDTLVHRKRQKIANRP